MMLYLDIITILTTTWRKLKMFRLFEFSGVRVADCLIFSYLLSAARAGEVAEGWKECVELASHVL